jgi:hypothetical protein
MGRRQHETRLDNHISKASALDFGGSFAVALYRISLALGAIGLDGA